MELEILSAYFPKYLEAFLLTVRIGIIGIGISFILGIIAAFFIHFKIAFFAKFFTAYIELFRNTPLLVQLFLIYFGLPKIGIAIPAEVCGALGLGLLGGSYMAEGFRSGLAAVSDSQAEGALALGMKKSQMFIFVIFPEAFYLSVPAVTANIIFLLKETSVFSAISLMDLMFRAKDLIGLYYNTKEALFLLVIFYMIMLVPVSIAANLIEGRVHYKMFGA